MAQREGFKLESSEVGGGQYSVELRSSGEREVVKTYKRGAVRRIDGGGGPTDLGGGLKRVLNVPPRFRGRFVQGRVRRRSFGLQWKPKAEISSKSGGGGGGSGGRSGGCGGGKTSVMIKNIPNQYRRELLIEFIDKLCEKNQLEYDFLYLPMDFLRKNSLGYAFVNFTSASAATKIRELLQGYKWGRIQTLCGSFSSSKICEVTYARIQMNSTSTQNSTVLCLLINMYLLLAFGYLENTKGKEALVQNFANSTFCCDNDEWLPVTFTPPRNGLSRGSSEQRTIGKWRARISY
ncbi:hypothetical protein LguiB_009868 [Lonicera macranthoides]